MIEKLVLIFLEILLTTLWIIGTNIIYLAFIGKS